MQAGGLDLETIIGSNLIEPTPRSAAPSPGGDQRKIPSTGGVPAGRGGLEWQPCPSRVSQDCRRSWRARFRAGR